MCFSKGVLEPPRAVALDMMVAGLFRLEHLLTAKATIEGEDVWVP